MSSGRTKKLLRDPSVKGEMSVEEIAKRHWEANYKNKMSLDDFRRSVAQAAQETDFARLRNTFIVMPDITGNEDDVEFNLLTGDTPEIYSTLLFQFCLSMGANTGIQNFYTTSDNKSLYKTLKKLFGDAIDVDETEEPKGGDKYTISIDIPMLYENARSMAAKQQQQMRKG